MLASYRKSRLATLHAITLFALTCAALAQNGGNSTSVTGTVLDPLNAVVPNAIVEIHNPVSGFSRTATTDSSGRFTIPNVPFNPYHLLVTAAGFALYAQDIDVRSVVPVNLSVTLKVGGSSESVTVEAAGDLLENDPSFHTDVDRNLFDRIPLERDRKSVV